MWLYEEKVFDNPTGYYGFVYEITCTETNKKYIGRKYFSKAVTKAPLKGRKNKRRGRADSDWLDYYGSSKTLLADIEKYGKEKFVRRILRLCKTRGEVNYWEAKLHFEHDVLNAKNEQGEYLYYNENIMMKFTRRNIG